ncbi:MAG: helix-turn-helix domain-containing protein, partial [Oscillospiraceae bacterium]|nr:helix-turn-helix domain-containing protein [Oscillospiraceae bacterium]
MKKGYASLGWPRRNPRHYRFAIPNKIWEYHLRPVEFMLLSYICYHCSSGHSDKAVSVEDVSKAVHMTVTSVKKYLTSLLGKGFVVDGWSLAPALQITNGEKFFTLPNEVFLLKLSPSAFVVYAYLLLIEDRRTHTCHPSYNTIAAATGTSKNTAMKGISALLEAGLISVESSSYFDKRGMKWKGNNLYTILPVRPAVDAFHQRQLRQLELDSERRRVRRRQEQYNH